MRETRYSFPGDVPPAEFANDMEGALKAGRLRVCKVTDMQREMAGWCLLFVKNSILLF